jgi:hypothetical protein
MDLKELEQMLHDATKGIAKVDKTYVNYDIKGQLFNYDIDFGRFLSDINYILKREKNDRPNK